MMWLLCLFLGHAYVKRENMRHFKYTCKRCGDYYYKKKEYP